MRVNCFSLRTAIILALLLASFAVLDQYIHKLYIFDQNKLHEISLRTLARNHTDLRALLRNLVDELNKEYPGHIMTEEDWVLNMAGGAKGQFWLLHGTISEYLIIFGTPIGTVGHTGRYFADDYFIMLDGEQWAFNPSNLTRQEWKVGEMHHLPRGEAQIYRIPDHGFALEYARGWIPLMFPFGFIETFNNNLDFHMFGKTFYLLFKSVINEFSQGKF